LVNLIIPYLPGKIKEVILESLFDTVLEVRATENFERTTTRYVYVAEFANHEVKIGMSKTPEKRLKTLARQERTSVVRSHYKKFFEAPKIEKILLRKYEAFLTYGKEYFNGVDFNSIASEIDRLYLTHGYKEEPK